MKGLVATPPPPPPQAGEIINGREISLHDKNPSKWTESQGLEDENGILMLNKTYTGGMYKLCCAGTCEVDPLLDMKFGPCWWTVSEFLGELSFNSFLNHHIFYIFAFVQVVLGAMESHPKDKLVQLAGR